MAHLHAFSKIRLKYVYKILLLLCGVNKPMSQHITRWSIALLALVLAFAPGFGTPATSVAQVTTTVTISAIDVGVAETAWIEGRIACGAAEG